MKNLEIKSERERKIFSSTQRDLSCSSFPPPAFPTSLRAGMELLKLMMFKTDFLSNGKCDDRVPPINLSQLPEFLLCKCYPTPSPLAVGIIYLQLCVCVELICQRLLSGK